MVRELISETIPFAYKVEYFPFNAQQMSMNIIILGGLDK